MEPSVTAIIFDWHGVLDHATYRRFSVFLAGLTGQPADEIREKVREQEHAYVVGSLEPIVFWEYLAAVLALTPGQLEGARAHLLTVRLNEALWALLPALRTQTQLAIISDCPSDKAARIRADVDLSLFATVTFSCDVGLSKADPDFFCLPCTVMGVDSGRCLFVDDTERHVRAAERLGFTTGLYTSPDAFRALVRAYGLLV